MSLALASRLEVNAALPSEVLTAKAADTTGALFKAKALSAEPIAALPAKSYVVTLACMWWSASAESSEPGTVTLNAPPAVTLPVYWLPFTLTVTVSPTLALVTLPVMVTLAPASAVLIRLSAVMLLILTVGVAGATVSTVMAKGTEAPDTLPAASMALAVML